MTNKMIIQCILIERSSIQVYFIAFWVYLLRENTRKIQEEIRILEIHLGRNQGRRTEYTPLHYHPPCPKAFILTLLHLFFYRGRHVPKSGQNVLYIFAKNRPGRPLFLKILSSIFLNYQISKIHDLQKGCTQALIIANSA